MYKIAILSHSVRGLIAQSERIWTLDDALMIKTYVRAAMRKGLFRRGLVVLEDF